MFLPYDNDAFIDRKLFVFDPENFKENNVTLSVFADEIQYIPLDNKIPVGLIYKFEITETSIFLSSKDIGILKFDRTGRNPVRIGSIGNGPGEYIYPMNFAVEPSSGTVCLNDKGNKIKIYTETGKYQKEFTFNNIAGSIDNIGFFNTSIFIYYFMQFGDAENLWLFSDKKGDIISVKKRNIPYFTSNWITGGGSYIFDNCLHYWNPYCDTVFKITTGFKTEPGFLFAVGEHRFPQAPIIPDERLKKMFSLNRLCETEEYRVFSYYYNYRMSLLLVGKSNDKYLLKSWQQSDIPGIPNDLDGGLPFEFTGYYKEKDNEYLTGIIYPDKLKAHVKTDAFRKKVVKSPTKRSELIDFADSLNDTDNPIIVLLRMKK